MPQQRIFPFFPKSTTLCFSNASRLPLEKQSQLSDLMRRFDRVMLERPDTAGPILVWADRVLRMFDA